MRKLLVIGIGVGDPDHMTVQAIKALNRVDVVFVPDKGSEKTALRDLRLEICRRFAVERPYRTVDIPMPVRDRHPADYRRTVDDWHVAIARRYAAAFEAELDETRCGGLLVWGDPALYDSTLRILDSVGRATDLSVEVFPGISSVQVLAARHRITLNRIGEAVHLVPGRRLDEVLATDPGSVVVLLDGDLAFERLDRPDLDIFWGAYLGTDHELLIAGPLPEVRGTIAATREQARRTHGWIMDTYLLRKRGS